MRLANGRSILDAVGDQTKALNGRVSGGDRKQLGEYFAAIRAAEKELAASDAWLARPKPEVIVEVPNEKIAEVFRSSLAQTRTGRPTDRLVEVVAKSS